VADSQQMEARLQMMNVSQTADAPSGASIQAPPFFIFSHRMSCLEKSIFSNFSNVKSSKIISHFLISHFHEKMHSLVRGIPLHEPALLVLVGHVEITCLLVESAHLLHLFVAQLEVEDLDVLLDVGGITYLRQL
jgi:hypothetical protein